MYPAELTAPMAQELENAGFKSLKTGEEVTAALDQSGTALVVVNSVCGCAAANARPGVRMAAKHGKIPNQLLTVFAGVDRQAVETAREYMLPFPPSSPSIALLKDGEIKFILERHNIEGRSAEMISQDLVEAFETYC
jgi:putative YphP/YqiW family bacilliredoxin